MQKKENKFYENPNYGGIIKPEEKKQMSIAQINDGIKEAQRQVQTYKNEWMDSVFSNASEQQISAAKNNMEAAKSDVVKLNEQLSAAYGLGKNGYWNKYASKINELVTLKDEYNNGMMGLLDGQKAVTEQEQAEKQDSQTEASQVVQRGNEAIESIRQYYLDKANANMDIKEFLGKYPYGSQMMQMWKDELVEYIGEEEAQKYIISCSKIEEGREKKREEIEAIEESERTEEKKDFQIIVPALESLIDSEVVEGTEDVSIIAQSVLDEIVQAGGFTRVETGAQTESFLTDAPVYYTIIDNNRVEMEVMTAWSAHPFGGEGTKVQKFFETAVKAAELMIDTPNTVKEIVQTAVEETIDEFGEEAADYFKDGRILTENDVRISIQLDEDRGTKYKYNYFYRDGQLILVKGKFGGVVWCITDEYTDAKR